MIKKSLLVLTLTASVVAYGETTQDLLIQKLTQVQLGLAPADPARASVLLRLADLHAERARQVSMKEIADGCTVCKAGDKDREKALSYYSEALTKVPANSLAKVYLQLGHLYELQGKSELAEKNYQAILGTSSSSLEKAEAQLSLAEMAFRKSDFAKAQELYGQVLKTEGASSQGLAAYRKAWCAFRLGNMSDSISQLQEVLKNPRLQSRMAVSRGVADVQFLEEVSRDLATFMAARGIQSSDAEVLYTLSPEAFRLQQVTLLAREGLRLGQKEASLQVWGFVFEKQSDPKARVEALVRMAQLQFDLKKTPEAAKSYQQALALWGAAGCSMENCDESGKGLKQFVVGWNRIENSKPSQELLGAYEEFLKVFTADEDMYIWGAQAAATLNQWTLATSWTSASNKLMVSRHSQETDKKNLAEKLEKNLLVGIEYAEKSKDEALLMAAQDEYLSQSIVKQKSFDVQYQKAYAIYQKGQYLSAAEQLKALALNAKGTRSIQIQAADLALDALALLKDDARIQQWSSEFASQFPEKKQEFQHISQKSVLTQSANLASQQPEQALVVLAQFKMNEATTEDRKVYLKNKILLNEKLNRIVEARAATEDLLKESALTGEEKEFALGRKLWFAELELDFATALKTAELMTFKSLSPDEKVLKLAMYAELANTNPVQYYSQYLKQSKDDEKKALIAIQLLRLSKNPVKDLDLYKPYFKNNMGLFAQAALEIYSTHPDRKMLERVSKEKASSKQDSFVMIDKILLLEDLGALHKELAAHMIDSKNQKTIALGLKARLKMLERLDGVANRAIALADWSAQLLTLQLVAIENMRFYNEALALPMPAGLTPEQENEYLTLLSQQVAPHQATAQMAEVKVKEFWAQAGALESYQKFIKDHPQWVSFVTSEVQQVAHIAPADQKTAWNELGIQLQGVSSRPAGSVSMADLESARTQLKKNPFSTEAIQNMLVLEKQAQRKSMVEYLEGRLAQVSQRDSDKKESQQ